MEERIGALTFISNFDSGNLARVEKVKQEESSSCTEDTDGTVALVPDYDYNVWTAPDCAGMECENGNRTWFYFGVKGGQPGKLLRINIMNLNRQGKLYSQGMSPLVKVVPSRNKWERIRDKPKFETVDGQFKLSFTYRFPDQRNGVCYFAFCYPYSYSECQAKLEELDRNFISCQQMTPSSPKDAIYYHRELLCYSLDNLRVDLLTVTSVKGMMDSREEWLPGLFPEKAVPRAHKFQGKKVFFLSARVHPGETPSSFVFNGFLDFILRRDDPRAAALRNQYVFKMIPILNPDGVKRGHYRTDPRGVNLNRVYLDPDPLLHPSIFAAKSVIVYHYNNGDLHRNSEIRKVICTCNAGKDEGSVNLENGSESLLKNGILNVTSIPTELKPGSRDSESVKVELQSVTSAHTLEKDDINNNNGKSETALLSENLNSLALGENVILSTVAQALSSSNDAKKEISIVNQLSNDSTSSMSSDCHSEHPLKQLSQRKMQKKELLNCCDNCLSKITEESSSGLAYYVDLHGHASKRGCFVYANYLENEDNYVSSILFPKLISLNSANFDFAACNFTEKNMYSKDKRDGMSKEGSGRVAVFKATGIVHSYTLECNYNCGRVANCLPPATCDSGRATPPPSPGFPPKYTTEIYEEVGRAVAVAVLDMNNSNPWSRLPLSEFASLEGARNWVKRFVKSSKNAPSVPKKLSRVISKTSSMVAGATAGTRQKLSVLTSSSSDMSSDNTAPGGNKITEPHPSQNGKGAHVKEAGKKLVGDTSLVRRPFNLATTRKSNIQAKGNINGQNKESFSHSESLQPGGTNKDHLPEASPSKPQVCKPKEQPRVSLELPKTGPTLRLVHNFRHHSQVHVHHVSPSSKTLSPPIEIKMSTVDVHKQFIGFQRGKASTVTKCPSNHSEEEKKKKNVRQRRKNGQRKEKVDEVATVNTEMPPMRVSLPTRPSEEEVADVNTSKKDQEGFKTKGPQLSRKNSSKNLISCSVMSCEVVDIKELPHTPQSSSPNALSLWTNTSVS